MDVWLIRILDNLGFNTQYLTDHYDPNIRFLDPGENYELYLPDELRSKHGVVVKKWKVKIGQKVYPESVICILEGDNKKFKFTSFIGGRLKYAYPAGQKIGDNIVIAEIVADV
ncbi:MAG: hypothetical protein Mars2KO_41540 [Maribacter sp.]